MAIARAVWRAVQGGLDFTSLVFVDETGTTTSMTRLRGWGHPGRPLIGKAPHGHWMTSTFVAGLRHDGIAAPMLINTPMTGRIFQQWLTEHLIPELPPGSIVVCDNLPAHKVAGVRECLEAAGMGLLYLPPYSPDLNPVEQAFAKIKALLRRAAPRSFDDHGPATTICNRFNRWSARGFWLKLLNALVDAGAVTRSTAIDSTYIKAQRSAFGGKGGLGRRRSGARAAGRPPRSTRSRTSSAAPTR